jgi:hypothetical protein
LKEKGRIFREVLRARQELTKAHFQILCLRRKIRKGKLAPEDREQLERVSYRRYAEALDTLKRYTGRGSNLYGLLRIFCLSSIRLSDFNSQNHERPGLLLQPKNRISHISTTQPAIASEVNGLEVTTDSFLTLRGYSIVVCTLRAQYSTVAPKIPFTSSSPAQGRISL